MQFKKHFSSNLQNLSVKKTLILNPPPNHTRHHYIKSQVKQQPLLQNQSPYQSRYSSNKQNQRSNQILNANYANSRNNVKVLGQNSPRDNTPPILTFNKIKRDAIEMMERQGKVEQHNRKLFKSNDNNAIKSNSLFLKQPHQTQSSKQLHYLPINGQNNKNIRLGSMVFGNLIKKDKSNRQKSPMRESRSFDHRLANLHTDRSEATFFECMNNDGQNAKYKIVKSEGEQEEPQSLYYCFNCAIYLVKQGFSIEELTPQDKKQYKMKNSNYMSKSDFYKDSQSSRYSANSSLQQQRIKVGEQIKCKIIMRLNKMKVNREQFNKTIESHLQNIDYFYHSLTSYIEQQRINDRQDIIRIKNIKKNQPENYQSQLSSCLGTIDYMMKKLQEVNYDYLKEVENLLVKEVVYPKMKINLEPLEGFQRKLDQFAYFFQNNLKIHLREVQALHRFTNKQLMGHHQSDEQQFECKNNPMRFSFEQALKKSSNRAFLNGISMNPLQEQNESQLQESVPAQRRQNAFRNLFPQDNEEYEEQVADKVKQSPMFKQF